MIKSFRRISLTQWIIISMIVGMLLGWLPGARLRRLGGDDLKPLSTIFLRMIKSLIVPLLFATLVVGIAGHGDDMKRVGRLAFRSIIYFEIVTTLALAVGLIAVNLVKPGEGVDLDATAQVSATVTDLSQRHVTLLGRARAHRATELLRRCREERSAADRLLRDHLRRRARAHASGTEEDVMLSVMRESVAR